MKPHRNSATICWRTLESDYNRLKAIIQAYLNTIKMWITKDFRESDPMEVDHICKGKSKGKGKGGRKGNSKGNSKGGCKGNSKGKSTDRSEARARAKARAKVKAAAKLTTTESATCAAKEVTPHDTVRHEPTMARW